LTLITAPEANFEKVGNSKLSDVRPYRCMFETSSGFHREFITPDTYRLSGIHLGYDDIQILQTMKNIIRQTLYIRSLKELY